jgi:hypothetical protein
VRAPIAANGYTAETRALRKATLAVIDTQADMAEADLWALGKNALALLDAFIEYRIEGRYDQVQLGISAGRLRGEHVRI